MYFKALLICALVTAGSGQSVSSSVSGSTGWGALSGSNGMMGALNSLSKAANGTIELVKGTAHTLNTLASQGIQGVADMKQSGVNLATNMASTSLKGGVEMTKQAVGIATDLAGMNPTTNMLKIVSGPVNTGADLFNNVGQTALSFGSGLLKGKINIMSGLAKALSGLASNAINIGANMAENGLSTGVGISKGLAGTLDHVMGNAAGGLPSLGGVSSPPSASATGSAFTGSSHQGGPTGSASASTNLNGGVGATLGTGLSGLVGVGSGLMKTGLDIAEKGVDAGYGLTKGVVGTVGNLGSMLGSGGLSVPELGVSASASGSTTRSVSPRLSPMMQTVF